MAYTIKGLAKANDCESLDEYGLAMVWNYWFSCNIRDTQCIKDFRRLGLEDMAKMMDFMLNNDEFLELGKYIAVRIYLD